MLTEKKIVMLSSLWLRRFGRGGGGLAAKVAVLGAGGQVGRKLSLLLKLNPRITDLALYETNQALGLLSIATDLSHINMGSGTRGFVGVENLRISLEDRDIVVIAGSAHWKASSEILMSENASVVADLSNSVSKYCPHALLAILTNPVHMMTPVAAEVFKKNKAYDPRKIFGVTTLDIVRACTFLGFAKGRDPQTVKVPCIGSHPGRMVVPLLSQASPKMELNQSEVESLTELIQSASDRSEPDGPSPALSAAYAASRFVDSLARALAGGTDIVDCSYVASDLTPVKFFASPLLLGRQGVEKVLPLPPLSDFENKLLKEVLPKLKNSIERAEIFVKKHFDK